MSSRVVGILGILAVVVTLAGLQASGVFATISNGSFESGLDGWILTVPPGGSAEAVTECDESDCGPNEFAPYLPVDGALFALLKTDGPGSQTKISQTISVAAGDTIAGWAFFFDAESPDASPYCDHAEVFLLSGPTVVTILFEEDSCSGPTNATTPWTEFTYGPIAAAGTLTIDARIANVGDDGVDSRLGVDAIRVIRAPETPTGPRNPNISGGAAGVVGAISDQARENRERANAAAAPAGNAPVSPPRTGTGSITPPSTGDAGLAEQQETSWLAALAVAVAVGMAVPGAVALRRHRL